MNIEIQSTADGSATILNTALHATYHSRHGAIQESRHIYMEQGLYYALGVFGKELNIVEAGLGTGLNAYLSLQEANARQLHVNYSVVEKFPLSPEMAAQLNYPEQLAYDREPFLRLHTCSWNETISLSPYFKFIKHHHDIINANFPEVIHCVYYDAFAPDVSPDMWEPLIFKRLYDAMAPGACLVTFCAKGTIKRLLKSLGFTVEALKGPAGKREMLRAIKN